MLLTYQSEVNLTKLVHYERDEEVRVGIVDKTRVVDLLESANELGLSALLTTNRIDEILSKGLLESLEKVAPRITAMTGGVPTASVKLRAPILNPEKMLLVARNYLSHNREQDARPPTEPYFFTKFRNALIGPGEAILIPRISKKVDWEAELAVVIGKAGKNIQRGSAMDHVAGYAVANDISFRDLQLSTRSENAAVTLGNN